MNAVPETLVIGSVGLVRDTTCPTHFFYYPAQPSLARHADDSLQLSWFAEASVLMLTTQWDSEREIQEQFSKITEFTQGQITFTSADAVVDEVIIELEDGQGRYQPIARVTQTSGYRPFQASFSIKLDTDQAARVESAQGAGKGIPIKITYRVTLQINEVEEVSSSLTGTTAKNRRSRTVPILVSSTVVE